jgi:DNA-binding NtrC family response regulator
LPVELVENELFGHEPGAYTGARAAHRGLIQQAEGGTLLLDEIDSLPLPAQAKLLRFLQEREYRPLGSNAARRADVRVLSATNHELLPVVKAGRFRQDLYFRLNVLTLRLPPLRERREDIPALTEHLLARHARLAQGGPPRFTPAAMAKLTAYDWPGNVRELENVIERALVMSNGAWIDESLVDLPAVESPSPDESFKAQKLRVVIQFERRYLEQSLARHSGNITRAAKAARKDRRAFFELLRKHNLAGRTNSEARRV